MRNIVFAHVYFFDHIIVHGVRNTHHAPEIIIQIDLNLIYKLTGIIQHHFLCCSAITLIKKNANKYHSYESDQGKRS